MSTAPPAGSGSKPSRPSAASESASARPAERAALTLEPRSSKGEEAKRQLESLSGDTEAALAAVPDVEVPATLPESGRVLIQSLVEAERAGRQKLALAGTTNLRSMAVATADQTAAIDAAEAASTTALQGHVETAQSQFSATAGTHLAALDASEQAQRDRLSAWHGAARARAHETVTTHQETITAAGAAHAEQLRASGAQASAAAQSGLDAASQTANSRSSVAPAEGDPRAAGHAEVADRLGRDAAGQFDRARPQLASKLQSHAEEGATELEQHSTRTVGTLDEQLSVTTEKVDQTLSGGSARVSGVVSATRTQLQDGVGEVHHQIESAGIRAAGDVRRHADRHRDDLQSASTASGRSIQQQTLTAATAAREHLDGVAKRLAAAHVGMSAAATAAPRLQADIADAYETTGSQSLSAGTNITDRLADAGRVATGNLAAMPSSASAALAAASQRAGSDLGAATAQAGGSLDHSTAAITTGGDEALNKTSQGLDTAVGLAQDGYGRAATGINDSLGQHVAEAGQLANSAQSGLHGRVTEGQQRVDSELAKQGQSMQRSILGSIGHWFAEQFQDLWNMLKSPGFLIGLVVTLVLFPFIGPAALVVGGVVGGIATGIAQNIKAGKAWYDPHNIIRDAFIGAVAGAAFAFGAGLIVGLGLEGLAATGALMGLSALIGIGINLFTGERWDKGLLANLFLGWLFERFGGGEEGGEEEQEEVPQAVDPYAALGKKFGLSEDVVDLLRQSGVDPALLDQALTAGVDHDTLALVAKDYGTAGVQVLVELQSSGVPTSSITRLLQSAKNLGIMDQVQALSADGTVADLLKSGFDPDSVVLLTEELGPVGVRSVDALVDQGVGKDAAIEDAQLAKSVGAEAALNELVRSGNLLNPQGLRPFLREVAAEIANGQRGKLTQLEEAALRSGGKGKIAIETSPDGDADVIDFGKNEALQIKAVTSKTISGVVDNIAYACRQLRGELGEEPPKNMTKIADARIQNDLNPLADLPRDQLLQDLVGNDLTANKVRGVDTIRVTNKQGTFDFSASEFP